MIAAILREVAGQADKVERSWHQADDGIGVSWSVLPIANRGGRIDQLVVTAAPGGIDVHPPCAPRSPSHSGILARSPFETWAFDRGTYRFLVVNEATTRRYGYTEDEFRTMRAIDLCAWEDVPRFVAMVTELGSGQSSRSWRHRTKDGEVFEVETEAVATESAGRPSCLVLSRTAGASSTSAPPSRRAAGESRAAGGRGLARTRAEEAVARALADHMQHVAAQDSFDGRGDQLVEAIARSRPGG
jgi:PAS domain S-box-containing protein